MARKPQSTKKRSRRVRINPNLTITDEHHNSLITALFEEMILPQQQIRCQMVARFNTIIRELSAFISNEGEMKEMEKRQRNGESVAIPLQKYGMVGGYIEASITQGSTSLFPARQM